MCCHFSFINNPSVKAKEIPNSEALLSKLDGVKYLCIINVKTSAVFKVSILYNALQINNRRLMKNPWISNAILISIKKRHKLFKPHFLSKNPDKIRYYKSYNNKLNKIKEAAKTNYYRAQFERNKGNLKTTWKLIGTIVNLTFLLI
jgi:hypothetical protein